MLGNKSIVFKLILVISLCSVLIFAVTLGYNYYHAELIQLVITPYEYFLFF